MYNTGIFSEFCLWGWDLNTGKWDLEKKLAGKWDWYPPSGQKYVIKNLILELSGTESNKFVTKKYISQTQ